MTKVFRLHREGGLELRFATLGASWLSCRVPMGGGASREAIVGNDLEHLPLRLAAYMGATIGRYANRIGSARIGAGTGIALTSNPGSKHQLHGGPGGFHMREWEVARASDEAIRLHLVSAAGDQGFPGEARVEVDYRLADAMTLEMEARVELSHDCPVCITNHAYFNLDGPGAAASDVRDHQLRIAAAQYLPVDGDLIPVGPLAAVEGSGFDFRRAKPLRRDWLRDAQQHAGGGYDHAFVLDAACADMAAPAAELRSRDGALRMTMRTTLPALQLYAGQYLHQVLHSPGRCFESCSGLALEPQFLPDSPNHPEWPQPSCWFGPGRAYRQLIRYAFEAA